MQCLHDGPGHSVDLMHGLSVDETVISVAEGLSSYILSPGGKCCEPNASRCAVQAPLAGEIIAYLAEEGDPVEYRQELVEIAPYFGALTSARGLVTLARQR